MAAPHRDRFGAAVWPAPTCAAAAALTDRLPRREEPGAAGVAGVPAPLPLEPLAEARAEPLPEHRVPGKRPQGTASRSSSSPPGRPLLPRPVPPTRLHPAPADRRRRARYARSHPPLPSCAPKRSGCRREAADPPGAALLPADRETRAAARGSTFARQSAQKDGRAGARRGAVRVRVRHPSDRASERGGGAPGRSRRRHPEAPHASLLPWHTQQPGPHRTVSQGDPGRPSAAHRAHDVRRPRLPRP
jgi:hypothetical protein